MSNEYSKRSRASALILIAALVIFTGIAVAQASSMQWPLFQSLKQLTPPKTPKAPPSSLFITAFEQYPLVIFRGTNPNNLQSSTQEFKQPIPAAIITVQTLFGNNAINVNTNYTDANGGLFVRLPAGNYRVLMRSHVANTSSFVGVYSGNTTELDILVNMTTYSSSFFEIINPITSGVIPPWATVFIHVRSKSVIIANANDSVYLSKFSVGVQGFSDVPLPSQSNMVGLQIVSELLSSSDGTLWLQAHLNSTTNANSISNLALVTFDSIFTINEYPFVNITS